MQIPSEMSRSDSCGVQRIIATFIHTIAPCLIEAKYAAQRWLGSPEHCWRRAVQAVSSYESMTTFVLVYRILRAVRATRMRVLRAYICLHIRACVCAGVGLNAVRFAIAMCTSFIKCDLLRIRHIQCVLALMIETMCACHCFCHNTTIICGNMG